MFIFSTNWKAKRYDRQRTSRRL